MNEEWRWVVGYEPYLMVSSFGRVKNLGRLVIDKNGKRKNLKEKIVNQTNSRGYKVFGMRLNSIKKNFSSHREIAKAFLPNPDNLSEVNHIDGNKSNNHVSNLEWCTRQQNVDHANANNLVNYSKKLDEFKILTIFTFKKSGLINRRISEKMNLSETTIHEVLNGKTWRKFSGI